jgi:acid-sensing ion channel, other
VIKILPLLAGFNERQWAYPRIEDLQMIDDILDLNHLSVDNAINQLGTGCSDFLLICSFAGTTFPCFQVCFDQWCRYPKVSVSELRIICSFT